MTDPTLTNLTRIAGPLCQSCRMVPATRKVMLSNGREAWRCQMCADKRTVGMWKRYDS